MARRKFEPAEQNKTASVVALSQNKGICENKLFFASRLKSLRTAAGLKQADLANAIGVRATAVGNWETGRARPDIANVPAICAALGITVDEFFSDTARDPDERQLVIGYRKINPAHRKFMLSMLGNLIMMEQDELEGYSANIKLLKIPYANDSVAAGIGTPGFQGRCETAYVHDTPLTRRADILFRVNGDSMEPKYPNGSIVLVKAQESGLRKDDIGVFQVDGELFIKQYRANGLHSLNERYPVMDKGHYQEIRTIGKVIGILDEKDVAGSDEIKAFERKQ